MVRNDCNIIAWTLPCGKAELQRALLGVILITMRNPSGGRFPQ